MGDIVALAVTVVGGMLALVGGVLWLARWSDDDTPVGVRGRARRLEAENALLRDLVQRLYQRAVTGRDVDPVSAVFADEIEAVMHTETTFTTTEKK
ncbi:MAG: hypothetical protein V4510_13455 [bacterium]